MNNDSEEPLIVVTADEARTRDLSLDLGSLPFSHVSKINPVKTDNSSTDQYQSTSTTSFPDFQPISTKGTYRLPISDVIDSDSSDTPSPV